MKYIKTKDGIYEVKCVGENHVYVRNNGQIFDNHFYKIKKEDIIKESDNIEELCDAFVCDRDLYTRFDAESKLLFYVFDTDEWELLITQEMVEKGIYGAIWTDKGLIYVAKMNKKGELELL